MNERLRGALVQQGMTIEELAALVGTDEKTVQRWITKERVPFPRNQRKAASALGVSVDYLWPQRRRRDGYPTETTTQSEIVGTYSDRSSVPRAVWLHMLESATSRIEFLVFAGTFLTQTNPRLPDMLAARAAGGVEVRLCFGDPNGTAVAVRDREEQIDGTLGAKIRASLCYFADLMDVDGVEIRLHDETLYASILRYDNEALINPHIWGRPASANPVLHLRDTGEDPMIVKYIESFARVWDRSRPWVPGEKLAS